MTDRELHPSKSPYGIDGNSSVHGKRYFTCPSSRGAFARPNRVTVGDFPTEDLEMDDDEEI
jgi:tubulin-specific chaperone B